MTHVYHKKEGMQDILRQIYRATGLYRYNAHVVKKKVQRKRVLLKKKKRQIKRMISRTEISCYAFISNSF